MPQNHPTIRPASPEDVPAILRLIRELAEYERMSNEVVATEPLLRHWMFERGLAEVLLVEYGGEAVGYALFFSSFSTFLGRAGLYLEDLYITPTLRGKGLGKRLLARVAAIAAERGCGRLEWTCLDWNRPSIEFYLSLGAEPMDAWTTYRLSGKALSRLAAQGEQPRRAAETPSRAD